MKRKLMFESCQNRLEATQVQNKINYLEKNKINMEFNIKNTANI